MGQTIELPKYSPPTTEEIERMERIQMIVATAIFGGYLSIQTSQNPPYSEFIGAGRILAISSVIYIIGKLFTIFYRYSYDSQRFTKWDRKYLPIGLIGTTGATALVVIIGLIPSVSSVIGSITVEIPRVETEVSSATILIMLALIFSLATTWKYSNDSSLMSASIDATVPNVKTSFTSGPKGGSFPLTLKAPEDKSIPSEKISITIASPMGLNIDIDNAKLSASGEWKPELDIPKGERQKLKVNISRGEGWNTIKESILPTKVYFDGQLISSFDVEIEG